MRTTAARSPIAGTLVVLHVLFVLSAGAHRCCEFESLTGRFISAGWSIWPRLGGSASARTWWRPWLVFLGASLPKRCAVVSWSAHRCAVPLLQPQSQTERVRNSEAACLVMQSGGITAQITSRVNALGQWRAALQRGTLPDLDQASASARMAHRGAHTTPPIACLIQCTEPAGQMRGGLQPHAWGGC